MRRRDPVTEAARRGAATAAILAVVASGCTAGSADGPEMPDPIASDACQPPEANQLPADYAAADLEGAWSLWMFADEGEEAGSAAGGLLELRRLEADSPFAGSAAVLRGTLELDPGEIGAADTGDLTSQAPERPGVLVLESEAAGAEGPRVTLRLGDRSNRPGRLTFDDAYAALHLSEAGDSTFAGRWGSGTGRGPTAGGRFCAVRTIASGG